MITGNVNIVNNKTLRQLISKGPKYRASNQICLDEAREEMQTGTGQFNEKISNDKGIKNHFLEWKSHVMSSVNKNVCTIKKKITCRLVKSIFSGHNVKNTSFSLNKEFVIVPIDKAANDATFICKYFYALAIIKELKPDCHLSNQYDSNTYTFINNKTKD